MNVKLLYALLFATFLTAPAAAQTPEQRADKIIYDVNPAENAMRREMAEAKRLKADINQGVLITPRAVAPPHHSMLPYIDNARMPIPFAGFTAARIRGETRDVPKQNTDGSGQFRTTCEYSHMSYDDPIVYPGQKGKSHLHVFFGNTAVDFTSTQASIENSGNSTCAGGVSNRTGYWVPAVIDTKDGTPLKPSKIMVYYKNDVLPHADVKPFPAGLRMVSGDMHSSAPQRRMDWGCLGPNSEQRFTSIPASCPVGYTIEATINFPMCWDGVNLDSQDHKSHMSYVVWNNNLRVNMCPTTHPILLPSITEKVQYKVTKTVSAARWRLSSDNYGTDKPGGYSIHGDWFNGWDAKVQDIWIKNCLKANRDCHGNLLGDGTALF